MYETKGNIIPCKFKQSDKSIFLVSLFTGKNGLGLLIIAKWLNSLTKIQAL